MLEESNAQVDRYADRESVELRRHKASQEGLNERERGRERERERKQKQAQVLTQCRLALETNPRSVKAEQYCSFARSAYVLLALLLANFLLSRRPSTGPAWPTSLEMSSPWPRTLTSLECQVSFL